MNQPVKTQLPQRSPDQVGSVAVLMKQYKNQIEAALPKHITADRLMRVCLTELRRNPTLQRCDPMSFLGAVVTAASLGLEPGGALGQCYLIPYGKEVQFQIGYRGQIDIARRSGNIVSISARCIYEGDEYEIEQGTDEKLVHKPKFQSDKVLFVYAVARLKDGGTQFEVMSADAIERHRKQYSKSRNVWDTAWEEMAKKTLVRRLFKMLPTSIELASALDAEERGAHEILDADYNVPADKVDPSKLAAYQAEDASAQKDSEAQQWRNKFAVLLTQGKKAPTVCGDDPSGWALKASVGELAAACQSMGAQ